jgi:hypothetical protein
MIHPTKIHRYNNDSPVKPATTLTKISAQLVTNYKTVIQKIRVAIKKIAASLDDPRTRASAPAISAIRPTTNRIRL